MLDVRTYRSPGNVHFAFSPNNSIILLSTAFASNFLTKANPMNQSIVKAIAHSICLWGILYGTSSAQTGQGGISNPYNPKPTVSPYLNLLQNGGGFNFPQYQTLVRPFFDQQSVNNRNAYDSQQLRGQVNSIQQRVNQSAVGGIRATGHPTRYMNYSHYYSLGQAGR